MTWLRGKYFGIGIAALGLVATAAADPKDFNVDIKPVFQSAAMSAGSSPIAAYIENKGPDAKGELIVSNGDSTTRYPIDLPRGSKKRILTYPEADYRGGGQLEFTLDTDQGRARIPYVGGGPGGYGGTYTMVLVSETTGDLGFLRQQEKNDKQRDDYGQMRSYLDAYCKPEDVPDRPVGFRGVSTVILGEGSERLSDDAVKALKAYALTGGTIIVVGGASAPILGDRRWASVLPAYGFHTKTVTSQVNLAALGGAPMTESFTIAAGTAMKVARTWKEEGNVLAASRSVGIGKIVLLAFNPFEEPFVRWAGRRRMLVSLAKPVDYDRAIAFMAQFQATRNEYDYSYPVTSGGTAGSGYYGYEQPPSSSPFDIQLPPPPRVFWILAGYFVVVVPLNFLILRKMKRGELAWVTAPVISLVFAGIFLNQASELYSAEMSTATTGLILADGDVPSSIFVGNTEMFFPRGGVYDLKMKGIDELGTGDNNQYDMYYRPNSRRSDIVPVDVGSVQVPDMSAANLAFEQLAYRQIVETRPLAHAKIVKRVGDMVTVRVTNTSGFSLTNAQLAAGGARKAVPSMEPGTDQEITFQDVGGSSRFGDGDNNGDPFTAASRQPGMIVLIANVQGFRPGPQIGAQVGSKTSIRMACMLDYADEGDVR